MIERGRAIAILRGSFDHVEDIAAAILEGGITAVEVTLNSPNALESIQRLSLQFGSRMAIGAGTVLTSDDVEAAAGAGARFIVSPNINPKVIQRTKQLDLVSLPGGFTPTEIVSAFDNGADAVKLFPAGSLDPNFVRALRAPFPILRTIPTGGVTPELARQYIEAGAWAVGIGSELVKATSSDQITTRAKEFADAVKR